MPEPTINDLARRVAVLEEIAASTKQVLSELRDEMRIGFRELRTELRDMRTELRDMRQRQERDFRLLFGAVIIATLGLAGLIARTQHWI